MPQFHFQAPPLLQPVIPQLTSGLDQQLRPMMALLGLGHPGVPIQVLLVEENTMLAQQTPSWVVGYAKGAQGIIVLLPERIPTYPYGSLQAVFVHEIAHVMTARASQNHPVPRWFDEGLAMMVSDRWDVEDRARLMWAMVGGNQISLAGLNDLFFQSPASARQAYVLSSALVRHLEHQWGPHLPRRVLALVAEGKPFPQAFAQTTGQSLPVALAQFWSEQTLWSRWIPAATSTGVLWLGITLLVFFAYRKRRTRAKAIQQQWEEEEDRTWMQH